MNDSDHRDEIVRIVAAGSNHSTGKEAMHELTVAEAKRTALIGQIDLQLVPERDNLR